MSETTLPTMSETVEVDVDQVTAFKVFTEEFDEWWGNGPIDAWDSSRVIEHRFEQEPGGRVLEIYADGVLELGQISVWEPPRRLSWTSSVDDVRIDVTFEVLTEVTTLVRVVGTAGSSDAGAGFAVVRMTPQWLPRYLTRRASGRTRPRLGPLNIVLRYREPAATARWLARAFGFETPADLPTEELNDPDHTWIEMRVGRGEAAIILWGLKPDQAVDPVDHLPWVYVDDLDSHVAHAEEHGAKIVSPIVKHGYRSYVAADPEGRHWLFAQAPPPSS
ncbi:MAG: VOC family protein [Acidimicrobiales bacterium]